MPSQEDITLLFQAANALSDAKRLWPERHPAAGMVRGIQEDSDRAYEAIKETHSAISDRIQKLAGDTNTIAATPDDLINAN